MLNRQTGHDTAAVAEKESSHKGKRDRGIIYLLWEGSNTRGDKQQSGRRGRGWLNLAATVSTIVSGIIGLFEFINSGEAGRVTEPIVLTLARFFGGIGASVGHFFVALGTAVGHLIATTTVLGPWGAAAAALFIILILRLLAERIGLFLTITMRSARRMAMDGDEGFGRFMAQFLISEYVLSSLLFLPLAALWVGAFYATVPRWGLAAFVVGYFATIFLATVVAVSTVSPVGHLTEEQMAVRVTLGQFISVLAAIATAIGFMAQGLVSASSPARDPWVAAIVALFATLSLRFFTEEIGFFSTAETTVSKVIYGTIVLSPIAVLWIGAFYTAVHLLGAGIFAAAFVMVGAAATEMSIPLMRLGRRS